MGVAFPRSAVAGRSTVGKIKVSEKIGAGSGRSERNNEDGIKYKSLKTTISKSSRRHLCQHKPALSTFKNQLHSVTFP